MPWFDFKYLDSLNLLEIWLIILIMVIFILAIKVNLAFLLLIPISSTLLFGFIFVMIMFILVFSPKEFKENITCTLLDYALSMNTTIEYIGDWDLIDADNSIIVVNYPTNFIEYLLVPIKLRKMSKKYKIVRTKTSMWAKYFLGSQMFTSLKERDNFTELQENIKTLRDTISIVYPEKNFQARQEVQEIRPFRTGIFEIAKNLKKQVYVCYAQQLDHVCGFITTTELKINLKQLDNCDVQEAFILMNKLKQEL